MAKNQPSKASMAKVFFIIPTPRLQRSSMCPHAWQARFDPGFLHKKMKMKKKTGRERRDARLAPRCLLNQKGKSQGRPRKIQGPVPS